MQKYYKLQNILNIIINDIKKQDFLVYFRKMSIVDISNDKVVFGVLSNFMEDNLRAKFFEVIKKAAKQEFETITDIDFVVDQNIDNPSNTDVIDCAAYFKEFTKKGKSKTPSTPTLDQKTGKMETQVESDYKKGPVNERYTMDNFIV
jgi:chromosomal replication initiation ATPase DnaA